MVFFAISSFFLALEVLFFFFFGTGAARQKRHIRKKRKRRKQNFHRKKKIRNRKKYENKKCFELNFLFLILFSRHLYPPRQKQSQGSIEIFENDNEEVTQLSASNMAAALGNINNTLENIPKISHKNSDSMDINYDSTEMDSNFSDQDFTKKPNSRNLNVPLLTNARTNKIITKYEIIFFCVFKKCFTEIVFLVL